MSNIDDILDSFEDKAMAEFFENDRYVGIGLGYSLKGVGFGEPGFGFDKETGYMFADTECSSVKELAKVIRMNSERIAEILISIEKEGNIGE